MIHCRGAMFWLLAVIALSVGSSAHADGCYIPPLVYQVPATIPQQRALIAFRDGRETLIIESSFQTEAKEVGWIIPLPIVPDKILPVSSGAMKTIAFRLQPEITHELPDWLEAACVLAGLVLYISFFIIIRPLGANRPQSLIEALSVLALFAIFAGMFLPALSSARGGAISASSAALGVAVEKQVQVGSYEVAILKAKNPDGLNQWLAENGFMALPEKADAVVSDYIAKGWCFSAAKLTRTEGGVSTPHPIRFDFATKEAIYPMRLTALAGAPVDLEIYAVGEKGAECWPMKREFCDTYVVEAQGVRTYPAGGRMVMSGKQTVAVGRSFGQHLGHPDLTAVMWDDCVVTRLSCHVAPTQMVEDFRLSWEDGRPYRHHYYSRHGARVTAGAWLFLLESAFGTICLFVARPVVRSRGRKWFVTRFMGAGVVVVIIGSAIFYLVLPKVDVRLEDQMGRFVMRDIAESLESGGKLSNGASVEEIRTAIQGAIGPSDAKDVSNVFFGEQARQEVSPGNYDIRREDGVWYLVAYDEYCCEAWYQISQPGK